MKQFKLKLIVLLVIFIVSCNGGVKITTKNLMEAFTIGWNKGYQQGLKSNNYKLDRSIFIQDSILMELYLSPKVHIPNK